jgi:hypothetical protein
MTMELRCLCGKAELVEPEPWNWNEAIGRAIVFMDHIEHNQHSPAENDSALARLRDLLEGWRARVLLTERGYSVLPFSTGGNLMTPWTRAENRTGRPEAVLPRPHMTEAQVRGLVGAMLDETFKTVVDEVERKCERGEGTVFGKADLGEAVERHWADVAADILDPPDEDEA